MNFYSSIHHVSKVEIKEITTLDSGTFTRQINVTTDDGTFQLTLFSDKYDKILVEQPKL